MQEEIEHDARVSRITDKFNQTLAGHMERLAGRKSAVGGLAMNVATISCVVLLAEQAANESSNVSTPSERYTEETMLNEMAELGVSQYDNLDTTLRDMIQRDYIELDDHGGLSAKEPAIVTARVLDRIFPKMPGMNFVAYFIQTMDECLTGRKDIEVANSQFDQTLKMQGVSLKKGSGAPGRGKTPPGGTKSTRTEKKGGLYDVYKRLKSQIHESPGSSRFGSKAVPVSASSDGFESKEVKPEEVSTEGSETVDSFPATAEMMQETSPADASDLTCEKEVTEDVSEDVSAAQYAAPDLPETTDDKTDISLEGSDSRDSFPATAETMQEISAADAGDLTGEKEVTEDVSEDVSAAQYAAPDLPETTDDKTDISLQDTVDTSRLEDESIVSDDELIEKGISAFEKDLSMQCPVCKEAKVKSEKTSMGKTYYKCCSANCNFVSWGKPYHFVCPECGNPFLIEATDRSGKTFLKCPRATCRYRQRLPGETEEFQEKTVRNSTKASKKPRRVVRKKRRVRKKK